MEEAKGDLSAFIPLDERFHQEIVGVSGNAVLGMIEGTLNRLTDRQRFLGAEQGAALLRAQQGHRQILQALRARDEEAYSEAVRRHARDVLGAGEAAEPGEEEDTGNGFVRRNCE